MRVFVSADMEGITGVATPTDVVQSEADYPAGRDRMVADVNAAVAGACEAGAGAVLVNDAHSSMTNLPRADLDERARLVRGNTKPRSMVQGLDEGHDVALFVGYHAMAGTPRAVLNHTFVGQELVRVRVDGTEAGELGCNARYAHASGVPVGLVTGDDAVCREADREVPGAERVAVKDGVDRFTADCRPPGETEPAIREAAASAVERAQEGDLRVPTVGEPATIAFEWSATNHAHRAAMAPGVEREGGRTTRVAADTYPAAYEEAIGMLRAGMSGTDEFYG